MEIRIIIRGCFDQCIWSFFSFFVLDNDSSSSCTEHDVDSEVDSRHPSEEIISQLATDPPYDLTREN